jgi:hypothetical protein
MHYFAGDGNYGGANDLVVVDTSKWTDEDWERIEETQDYKRSTVAMSVSASYGV